MKRILVIILWLFAGSLFSQKNIVAKVAVSGLEKTNEAFIVRLLKVKAGQELDTLLIQKDIQKLNQLVSVANATFQIQQTGDTSCHITYYIVENFTLIPQINVWTIDEVFSYNLGLYEYNLLGRNIMLGGFYPYNGFPSYGVNFKAPYLFSDQWGMGINYRNWISREPLYFDEGLANYRYNNESFDLMGMYELNVNNRFELGGSHFIEKYHYLGGGDPVIESQIPLAAEKNKLMFKMVYEHANVRSNYYLLSGVKNQFYLQTIVTENDFENIFLIAWNDLLWYQQVGGKGNFATRLRLGLATNEDSPFAPFAVDNNVNIRGVGYIIDRGSGSIVWNVEYRHTLLEKNWLVLQSNLFVDMGSWRNPGGGFSDFAQSENIRIYPGGGLRIIHKKIYNAIFRIDYGHDIEQEGSGGIVFGVGQYF